MNGGLSPPTRGSRGPKPAVLHHEKVYPRPREGAR